MSGILAWVAMKTVIKTGGLLQADAKGKLLDRVSAHPDLAASFSASTFFTSAMPVVSKATSLHLNNSNASTSLIVLSFFYSSPSRVLTKLLPLTPHITPLASTPTHTQPCQPGSQREQIAQPKRLHLKHQPSASAFGTIASDPVSIPHRITSKSISLPQDHFVATSTSPLHLTAVTKQRRSNSQSLPPASITNSTSTNDSPACLESLINLLMRSSALGARALVAVDVAVVRPPQRGLMEQASQRPWVESRRTRRSLEGVPKLQYQVDRLPVVNPRSS